MMAITLAGVTSEPIVSWPFTLSTVSPTCGRDNVSDAPDSTVTLNLRINI